MCLRIHLAAAVSVLGVAALVPALACTRPRDGEARSANVDGGVATPLSSGARASTGAPPTYWNRIAGILETHCTKCHARGGIGPMPLTTYAEAKENGARMVAETRARRMPPWLPDTSRCAKLEHSRAMPEADIEALARWHESGAPEGDPKDHRAREIVNGFGDVKGAPDLVAAPESSYMPKRGRADDYHCFVIDPKLTANERVTALRIAPGEGAIVHHVLLFEVRKSALDKVDELDAKEAGPGYTCFGGIGVTPTVRAGKSGSGSLVDFDAQMIVAWAPGAGATDVAGAPTALPAGTSIQLAAGSRLVMQVHYSLENHRPGMTDKTRVEMWLAKPGEPRRQAVWVPLLHWSFRVPPGVGPEDPRATAHAEVGLPLPLTVLGVAPHMHLRGRSAKIEAIHTEANDSSCLLDVPRWDFHHQEAYWLSEGVRVDRAALTCTWDNREAAQPLVTSTRRRPTRELHWGEGTDDEMCLAFLYTTL
ncbi:MAG: hypothetical protein JST00_00240 [Deltaproteobacteria bacterium]|nr:hypothetical protein [Deltaproteobacteria bacterium]